MNDISLNYDPLANTDNNTCQDPYTAQVDVAVGQFGEEVSWFVLNPFQTVADLMGLQQHTVGVGEWKVSGTDPADPGYQNGYNYSYSLPIAAGQYMFVAQGKGYGWTGTRVVVSRTDGSVVFNEVPPEAPDGEVVFHQYFFAGNAAL